MLDTYTPNYMKDIYDFYKSQYIPVLNNFIQVNKYLAKTLQKLVVFNDNNKHILDYKSKIYNNNNALNKVMKYDLSKNNISIDFCKEHQKNMQEFIDTYNSNLESLHKIITIFSKNYIPPIKYNKLITVHSDYINNVKMIINIHQKHKIILDKCIITFKDYIMHEKQNNNTNTPLPIKSINKENQKDDTQKQDTENQKYNPYCIIL